MNPSHGSAEAAARASYGRLLAILASRTRDIAGAEDALADAFASALATWPTRGVPDKPEAWLLTTARNRLHNTRRHRLVHEASAAALRQMEEETVQGSDWSTTDERLRLLFVCAHPAIDASVRTALMLQTVLGLDAERIGGAFLVAPSTMGQRLVRAKNKIKEAGIRFSVPEEKELPARLEDVLAAVYAAYGTAWDDATLGLNDEALFLARLLATLLPGAPETLGLLSLLLFCESRAAARRDNDGRFVPLREQNAALWRHDLIAEAEHLLMTAARAKCFGRFQCEAAIQSVHAQRAVTGQTNHAALCQLYDLLLDRAPSLGVAVSRAAALTDAGRLDAAAKALEAIDLAWVKDYQAFWVTRAHLARARGEHDAAKKDLLRAIGLTKDPAVREFLLAQV